MALRQGIVWVLMAALAAASACEPPVPTVIPDGMVYIPGGRTLIGSYDGPSHESPTFMVRVKPFFMDSHPVTVREFAAFVEATDYVTEAEHFGSGAIFDFEQRAWVLKDSASWRSPLGLDADPAPADHPVTQVSWNDAQAYAAWADKRLPTEVEWEHAARGARNAQTPYAWGSELSVDGAYKANVWNGTFPFHNSNADGFVYTSPVGVFGATEVGLVDMGGNVWEWVSDWYRSYAAKGTPYQPTRQSEKVQRGGSFLCEPGWCHGYRVSGRSHSSPESSLFHVGFRCVKDIDP